MGTGLRWIFKGRLERTPFPYLRANRFQGLSLLQRKENASRGPRRSKQTRFKKECYLMRQDNTIYTFSIKVYFSNKEQNKSQLQKQISNIFISNYGIYSRLTSFLFFCALDVIV